MKFLLKNFWWMVITCYLMYVAVDYRISEYRSYLKYNGMHGVVIDNYISVGRYMSCSLPTIRLDDGTIGSVNGGNHQYSIGETFVNNMDFNWIGGRFGTAYSIDPNTNFVKYILCITVEFFLGLCLLFGFGMLVMMWNRWIDVRLSS